MSLPSWERGLKYCDLFPNEVVGLVAPLVGAWIEIQWSRRFKNTRVVAPLVGAWIEIADCIANNFALCVAPLVGAWIEIF